MVTVAGELLADQALSTECSNIERRRFSFDLERYVMGEKSIFTRLWDEAPDVLLPDEVAFLLNVDISTVYRKGRTGEYPRMNCSDVKFDKATLRAHLTGSLKTKENQISSGIGTSRKKVQLCL